jgi:hypothetical protein
VGGQDLGLGLQPCPALFPRMLCCIAPYHAVHTVPYICRRIPALRGHVYLLLTGSYPTEAGRHANVGDEGGGQVRPFFHLIQCWRLRCQNPLQYVSRPLKSFLCPSPPSLGITYLFASLGIPFLPQYRCVSPGTLVILCPPPPS